MDSERTPQVSRPSLEWIGSNELLSRLDGIRHDILNDAFEHFMRNVYNVNTHRTNEMDTQESDRVETVSQLVGEVQVVEESMPEDQGEPANGIGASDYFEDEHATSPPGSSQPIPEPQPPEADVNLMDIVNQTTIEAWEYIVSYIYSSYNITEGTLSLETKTSYTAAAKEASAASAAQGDHKENKQAKLKNKFKAMIESGAAKSLIKDSSQPEPADGVNMYSRLLYSELDDPYIFRLVFISVLNTLSLTINVARPNSRHCLITGMSLTSRVMPYYSAPHRPYNLYQPTFNYI